MQSTEINDNKIADDDNLLINDNDNQLIDDIDDLDDLFIKPVKKKKILMLSDHPIAPSGVGIQARLLIEGLLKTGKYSFRCLGGALKHADYNTIKMNDDWLIKPIDGFGTKEMIRELLIYEKPDAILLFTDPRQFIWLWEMEDEIHQICPITYWHVWDNDPYPSFNAPWYESTDLINCLAYKTYELVKPNYPEKTNYIPHAFPKQMYYPIPDDQVKTLMTQNFHGREDWFKVLWVNRNATRKMPNDVLVSWKKFLDNLEAKHGHKKAILIMHTDPNDHEGPNLLASCEMLKLHENVWFSTNKIDFSHMNILYNLCDTCVNISKNEGFGLCLSEETVLMTQYEIKKIKDIIEGDLVRTSSGKYEKVLATSKRKENKIIELHIQGRDKIISSEEHPFMIWDEKTNSISWKQSKQIKEKDYFCYPKPIIKDKSIKRIDLLDYVNKEKYQYDENFIWNKMGYSGYKNGLSISEIMEIINCSKHYAECIHAILLNNPTTRKFKKSKIDEKINELSQKLNKKPTDIIVNNNVIKINRYIKIDSEFYSLLGWYLAEGSSSAGNGIEFSLHKNEYNVATWIKNYFKKTFNINGTAEIHRANNSRFYCSSNIVSEFFENICGKFALNKKLSNDFMSKEFSKDLIKSLINGDGSHDKNARTVSFTSISIDLVNQISDLLAINDIFCSIKNYNIDKDHDYHDSYILRVKGESYDKLCNLIGYEYKISKNKNLSKVKHDENYFYAPIKKIVNKTLEKPIDLYDIQIENSKNFVANGVVAHNSTLITMQVGKPIIALCSGGETRQVIDYRDGSENGVAIKPVTRSLVGSQMVPFIYEDFASLDDVAAAYMKVYEMTNEEKAAMKEKVTSYVDHEFNYDLMIQNWDATLEKCIDDFKAKLNRQEGDWSLTSIEFERQ